MRPKTSVNPLATRKYSAARVSPFMAVLRKSFALSARPHTTNAAAGTPITTPQNHRQKRDMPALAHPIHEAAIDRDRTGGAAGGSRTRPPPAWFVHGWCGLRNRAAPARLRGANLRLLVEHAVLHDREQLGRIAQDRQVRERVAVHQQEVGEVAVLEL